jgi:hypothetical protein
LLIGFFLSALLAIRCFANEHADVGGGSQLGFSGGMASRLFYTLFGSSIDVGQLHPVVIAILFVVCVDLGFFLLHMLGSESPFTSLNNVASCPTFSPSAAEEDDAMDVDLEAGGILLFPGDVVDGKQRVVRHKM